MKLKLTLNLVFEVDGRVPTSSEKDAFFEQIAKQWPISVYTYGDEEIDPEGALVLDEIWLLRWTRHKTQE